MVWEFLCWRGQSGAFNTENFALARWISCSTDTFHQDKTAIRIDIRASIKASTWPTRNLSLTLGAIVGFSLSRRPDGDDYRAKVFLWTSCSQKLDQLPAWSLPSSERREGGVQAVMLLVFFVHAITSELFNLIKVMIAAEKVRDLLLLLGMMQGNAQSTCEDPIIISKLVYNQRPSLTELVFSL